MAGACRRALHAGSWYSDNGTEAGSREAGRGVGRSARRPPSGVLGTHAGEELRAQLQGWLEAAGPPTQESVRALIGPHAGYSYSGPTAAYAYKEVRRLGQGQGRAGGGPARLGKRQTASKGSGSP
jgi:predicted class III extradiol MEMO1 family dioxygenase